MKEVTRIHTCVIARDVLDYIIKSGGLPAGCGHTDVQFMELPPKERLIHVETVTPCRPLHDGSIMTQLKVTELVDDE